MFRKNVSELCCLGVGGERLGEEEKGGLFSAQGRQRPCKLTLMFIILGCANLIVEFGANLVKQLGQAAIALWDTGHGAMPWIHRHVGQSGAVALDNRTKVRGREAGRIGSVVEI